MARPSKKTGSKKTKKNIPNGVAHIQSTFNNTIVSISDANGEVISWASAGSSGFKGAKKGTPFAAAKAAEAIVNVNVQVGAEDVAAIITQQQTNQSLSGSFNTVNRVDRFRILDR